MRWRGALTDRERSVILLLAGHLYANLPEAGTSMGWESVRLAKFLDDLVCGHRMAEGSVEEAVAHGILVQASGLTPSRITFDTALNVVLEILPQRRGHC